jgi:hypothetical protein
MSNPHELTSPLSRPDPHPDPQDSPRVRASSNLPLPNITIIIKESISLQDHPSGHSWHELASFEKEPTKNPDLRRALALLHLSFHLKAGSQPILSMIMTGHRWDSRLPEDVILDFRRDRRLLSSTLRDPTEPRILEDGLPEIPSPGRTLYHIIQNESFDAVIDTKSFRKLVLWGRTEWPKPPLRSDRPQPEPRLLLRCQGHFSSPPSSSKDEGHS